jgi:hypothetical protein
MSKARSASPVRELPYRAKSRGEYVEALVDELRKLMLDLPETIDMEGRLGTPTEAAERLAALVPRPSPWSAAVGPVYTQQQVRLLTGAGSRQALADRVQRKTLLGLRTSDGHVVYPVFQFVGNQVLPGLNKVLQAIGEAVNGWTVASWLCVSQPGLAGRTVIEHLALKGGADEDALKVTGHALERWSR